MTKIKIKTFWFRTPHRRKTKNITGNKAGWQLTGWECLIIKSNRLTIDSHYNEIFNIGSIQPTKLFQSNVWILAIWWFFKPSKNITFSFSIESSGISSKKTFELESNKWVSIGLDLELDLNGIWKEVDAKFTIWLIGEDQVNIDYKYFQYWSINYEYFIENDVYRHFSNSKKYICFPEQFYFDYDYLIGNKNTKWDILILKGCNRCKRYLPINPTNEREQLSFSNHCTSNAPCKDAWFFNYKINYTDFSVEELGEILHDSSYKLWTWLLFSYYWHQIECKACKKFFVNAPLNPLRTSTQHREDSLRRRAFERLVDNLLDLTWIYHKYKIANQEEFDTMIRKKFGKKCFKCGKTIEKTNDMDLDHTMPLVFLYPLDEHATCLCPACNSAKGGLFPVDFYTSKQLEELSRKTWLWMETLLSRKTNLPAVLKLKEKIVWFIDDFLKHADYTKERDWKISANSIYKSVQKAINNSDMPFDIKEVYQNS